MKIIWFLWKETFRPTVYFFAKFSHYFFAKFFHFLFLKILHLFCKTNWREISRKKKFRNVRKWSNVKFSAKKVRFLQSDFNFSLKTLFETNSLKKPKESRYSKLEGHSKLRLCNPPPPLSQCCITGGQIYFWEKVHLFNPLSSWKQEKSIFRRIL